MFNWRMCFPFKYMPEEKVMVVEKKEHFWSLDKTKQTLPPIFNLQVWDNDLFSANDFIGKQIYFILYYLIGGKFRRGKVTKIFPDEKFQQMISAGL